MKPNKILIAVPMLKKVDAEFFRSMIGLDTGGTKAVLGVAVESLIDSARNDLVRQAIEGNCDYIMWFDSDMIFEADTLRRFIKHAEDGLEYVCGLYFARQIPTVPVIAKTLDYNLDPETGKISGGAEIYLDYPRDQLFEIAASGFGGVMVKTSLFQEVIESFKVGPFDRLPQFGEDYSFCYRLQQMGKKMYCDSSIKFGHVGTYVYTEGTYLDCIRREMEDDCK